MKENFKRVQGNPKKVGCFFQSVANLKFCSLLLVGNLKSTRKHSSRMHTTCFSDSKGEGLPTEKFLKFSLIFQHENTIFPQKGHGTRQPDRK